MDVAAALQGLFSKFQFSQVLFGMALIMGRILPITFIAPFLGGDLVQSEVKMGIGVMLGIVMYPLVAAGHPVPIHAFAFMGLLIKEVAVGGTIAFVASMAFEACRAAGTFVDTMSGANMATAMVPYLQQQASLFADLQFQFAVVLFLSLDGHHVVIRGLADSFAFIPIDSYPKFSGGTWGFFELMLRSTSHMLIVAVALAAPAAAATFLTDIALGLVNRVAPQIQVYFMAMNIKPLVVVFIMMNAFTFFGEELAHQFTHMLGDVRRALDWMR
jgi:flagellar biosynthetic protein FliR